MSQRPMSTDVRKKSHKIGIDGDEARRRREDVLVEIRKGKREENLSKKRREGLVFQPQQLSVRDDASKIQDDITEKLESIPLLVQGVWSYDYSLQLYSTTQLKILLSTGMIPLIDKVIKEGIIPRFVQFIERSDTPQLQYEALWALTNVLCGKSEHRRVVIDHGVIPIFVQLLSSPSDDVRDQVMWVLGNIAAGSPTYRDLVLNHGALLPLLRQLNEHSKDSTLRNGTWALSKFLYGTLPLSFEQVKPALEVLCQLLQLQNEEVLAKVIDTLSCLWEGPNNIIQVLIDAGVCSTLVQLLTHSSPKILSWALRVVGNIVGENNRWTQIMIDNKVLPCLYQLLIQDHNKFIKKDACWTLSNIMVGTNSQIQDVIDANIIPPLIHLLQNAELDVKMEAAWAIRNATFKGSYKQLQFLVKQDCLKPLCDLLVCSDAKIIFVCLEGLDKILNLDKTDKEKGLFKGINIYAEMIAECDGLQKILGLQTHDDIKIYEKTVKILENYWAEDIQEVETQILPKRRNTQQIEFGSGSNQQPNLPPGSFKFG